MHRALCLSSSLRVYPFLMAAFTLLVTILFTFKSCRVAAQRREFVTVQTCTCEGYSQVYECTVDRESATVWTGTAFNCPRTNNEIFFQHGIPNAVNASCNNGAISGRVVRADNDSYTSQLSILVTSEVLGGNVSCLSDGMRGTTLIGSTSLILKTVAYPPPTGVRLLRASLSQLTFQWAPVSSGCSAIHYQIIASNCGHCPNTTDDTTITCTGAYTNGQQCVLSVRTIVCDGTAGNESKAVFVNLRVPDPPVVNIFPTYSYEKDGLSSISVKFAMLLESFNISAGVDGSALSYTVIYSDTASGIVCASATLLATSCVHNLCVHHLRVPSSNCSTSRLITVNVLGNNLLGPGELSVPVYVNSQGTKNEFVDISFDWQSKMATCLFLHQQNSTVKTCSIAYGVRGENGNCNPLDLFQQSGKSRSSSVYVGLLTSDQLVQHERVNCFILTASNGTRSLRLEGAVKSITGTRSSTAQSLTIGILPLATALGGLMLVIIIIIATSISIIVLLIRSKKALRREMASLKDKMKEQPAIYEELSDYVHKPQSSSPTDSIDTGRNTAYISLAALARACQ